MWSAEAKLPHFLADAELRPLQVKMERTRKLRLPQKKGESLAFALHMAFREPAHTREALSD